MVKLAFWTLLLGIDSTAAFAFLSLPPSSSCQRNSGVDPVRQRLSLSLSRTEEESSLYRKKKNKRKRQTKQHVIQQATAAPPQRRAETETWRIFNVEVHPDALRLNLAQERNIPNNPSSNNNTQDLLQQQFLHPAVLESLRQRLHIRNDTSQKDDALFWSNNNGKVRVVRRSLDARAKKQRQDGKRGPRFVYVLDVDIPTTMSGSTSTSIRIRHVPGKFECLGATAATPPFHLTTSNEDTTSDTSSSSSNNNNDDDTPSKRVIIVGAGPAGLFCALQLARQPGITPILLERGQAVEVRGRDIGALMHRRLLQRESNYAFGEGGAGTWSDGKLTTRIGRNSVSVRSVLETLVQYGAPPWILLDGAPHLGTDNLVRLLRNMRRDLRHMGGQVHFGTKVTGFVMENGVMRGVEYEHHEAAERNLGIDEKASLIQLDEKGVLYGDAVVLATGHSARDVYEQLHAAGVQLEPKGFAVGFRIEHPQKVINKIQYNDEWGPSVVTGKETTDTENIRFFESQASVNHEKWHEGRLPVPSYRLATDKAFDGTANRGVYSFCMCPGGQIVPASTDPEEVCVNGMSFSRRDSLWANSALVVTVNPDDLVLASFRKEHGVLAGIAFQRAMERKAAAMGGGNLCVPVQRVTDFIAGNASTSATQSSYRLGVRPSPCHEIYPAELTAALRHALVEYFDKQMPGYVCHDGLLHAVETRTSSPVRVSRDDTSLEAIGVCGLYPAGEGAGFAGGIVSAAVDGIVVAEAVIEKFGNRNSKSTNDNGRSLSASRNAGIFY